MSAREIRREARKLASTMTFSPTPEQIVVADCFKSGGDVRVQAGAGTGKTSTLKYVAGNTRKRGAYLAFNRALVEDAKGSMPANVSARTIHSLAMGQMIGRYQGLRERLNSGRRVPSSQVARLLGIDGMAVDGPLGRKFLTRAFLAGQVMKALRNFCQSADLVPGWRHFEYIQGIDGVDENGARRFTNNDVVRRYLEPFLAKVWADICDPGGRLRFEHAHYLKLFALLPDPRVSADFVMVDEYQDVAPVMQQIIGKQTHAQIVGVGDSAQSIYGFTGAIDALERMQADHDAWLTQSFRFGPAIAEQANKILERLDSELRLRGTDAIPSRVGPLAMPQAILTRTNATSVVHVLQAIDAGIAVHLVGGGTEVIRFAEAAEELREVGHTEHPELACFNSWAEVQQYVQEDPQGSDLKLLVDLIDEFGADVIVDALAKMPDEREADLVVSTAHKSKGRQWDSVQLADDFPDGSKDVAAEELRLLYVAATRARRQLDIEAVGALADNRPGPAPGVDLDNLALDETRTA